VGAGAETKLWGNWIGRAEYTYAHFNDIDFNYADLTAAPASAATAGGVAYTTHMDLNTHTFVVGVGYKFGS
jgi:opacity protein-like surface antigen